MRIVVNDGIRLTGKITPPTSQSRHVLARLHARVGKPFGRGDGRWKYLRAAMDVTAGGAFESEVWPEGTIIISWMMSPPPVDLAGDDPFSQLAGKEPMIVPNDSYELHLDAKDVHTLRVHVRGVSGDPGPDVRWWALPLSSDAAYFKLALSGGCGDPGGRLALPLTKGKWMIALMNDDGYALHHVSVGDAELDTVQMQLTAFDRMVLQLEGADGKPVPRVGAHGPNLRIDPFARRLLNSARGNANGLLVLRYAHIQDRELSTSLYGGGNLRTERFALKPTTEPLKLRMK
jgi:hypothetical protein